MQAESIELGFLSILALITFFIFLIIEKLSNKNIDSVLMDKDFSKPQSFHDQAISRSGGIGCFLSFLFFLFIYFLLYSQFLYIYLFVGISLFLIGYLDDIKIKISPNLRLILMIISLTIRQTSPHLWRVRKTSYSRFEHKKHQNLLHLQLLNDFYRLNSWD